MISFYDKVFKNDCDLQATKKLLLSQPELSYERQGGRNLLHRAVVLGQQDVVRLLLEVREGLLYEGDKDGYTPLHLVGETLWLEGGDDGEIARSIAKILLDSGASVERKNNSGQTPLLAMFFRAGQQHGWLDTIRILLEAGSDPNAKDKDGCTYLHYIANESDILSRLETTRLLIRAGATSKKNLQGQTPFDVALSKEDRMPRQRAGRIAKIAEISSLTMLCEFHQNCD